MFTIDMPVCSVRNVRDIANDLGIPTSEYLMSRRRLGIPLRETLVHQLEAVGEGVLMIDFADVEEVSISVAEELGPRLFGQFLALHEKRPQLFLAYCNFTDDLLSGWQRIFQGPEKNMVACVFESFNGETFAGHHFVGDGLPDALYEVLDQIYRMGAANSTELEAKGIAAASRKLNALTNKFSWLLRRTQVSLDERAWNYIYTPVVPTKERLG
jgi:hypothetical protein